MLRVDRAAHQLSAVPLGDSSAVVVGEPVAAIGSPFGNESSLTVGVVSATKRSIASLTSIYNVVDAIQIDAPINRGNSGGPLFDARGRVIGINAQIRTETGQNEGVGFAIPINAAKRSLEQLVQTGTVHYAYVGVTTSDLTPTLARRFGYPVLRGAVVNVVRPRSPAARAGIRPAVREEEFNGLELPRRRRRDRRDRRSHGSERGRRRPVGHRAGARPGGRLHRRPRREAGSDRRSPRRALAPPGSG